MASMEGSDKLQAHIDRPFATPETHRKAYATLKRLHGMGKLPPVPGGTGDPLNDYVEILGIKR